MNWRNVVFDYRVAVGIMAATILAMVAVCLITQDTLWSLVAVILAGLFLMIYLNAGYDWWKRKVEEYRSLMDTEEPDHRRGPWG